MLYKFVLFYICNMKIEIDLLGVKNSFTFSSQLKNNKKINKYKVYIFYKSTSNILCSFILAVYTRIERKLFDFLVIFCIYLYIFSKAFFFYL